MRNEVISDGAKQAESRYSDLSTVETVFFSGGNKGEGAFNFEGICRVDS